MTPEEQAKADAAQEAAEKAAAAEAAKLAAEAKKSAKKKTIDDLKPHDDVAVEFKNPVHVSEDGENTVEKQKIIQHVKYAYWLALKKDAKGNVSYAALRGAKLIGYVENGKVIPF